MCGRTFLITSGEDLAEAFGLEEAPEIPARYNIAPGQDVLAVRADPRTGRRLMASLRWGLVPWWTKGAQPARPLIMARAESAERRPAFRDAFQSRRCLLPASGFYEWRRTGRTRQPFVVRRRDARPFAIAGVWDRWKAPDGRRLETCAVLTTPANDLVARIHDRMPAILDRDAFEAWLDPRRGDVDELKALLRPYPTDALAAYAVTPRVNRTAADDPSCLEPADKAGEPAQKTLW